MIPTFDFYFRFEANCFFLSCSHSRINILRLCVHLELSVAVSQDLLMNDQVKEFAANVYETFSTPQELQK